jgi:hypothetical protein
MKSSLSFCVAQADDILVHPGKIITQPDLRQPLGPEWSVARSDGQITAP